MKAKLFSQVAAYLPFVLRLFSEKTSLRIVYYHRVNQQLDEYYFNTGITPAVFQQQLEYFSRKFTVIGLPEAIRMAENGDRFNNHLCITFDDGFRECHDVIRPVLNKFGFKATFFVIEKSLNNLDLVWRNKLVVIQNKLAPEKLPHLLGKFQEQFNLPIGPNLIQESSRWEMSRKDEMADFLWQEARIGDLQAYLAQHQPYLTDQQVVNLLTDGHHIGCHTYSHPFCSKLTQSEIEREVIQSARNISERYSISCDTFSYPFGDRASRENEEYILANSNLKVLLGIGDQLGNKHKISSWERVGVEKRMDKSKYSFYVSPFIRKSLGAKEKAREL